MTGTIHVLGVAEDLDARRFFFFTIDRYHNVVT
jgi:hypothetical protein